MGDIFARRHENGGGIGSTARGTGKLLIAAAENCVFMAVPVAPSTHTSPLAAIKPSWLLGGHTCAALSIAAAAHPKLISARLSHSSIQVTLDRYGHLFPSMEEALPDALDAAFAAGDAERVGNVARLRP